MSQENLWMSIKRRLRQDETLQRKSSWLFRHEPTLHHQRWSKNRDDPIHQGDDSGLTWTRTKTGQEGKYSSCIISLQGRRRIEDGQRLKSRGVPHLRCQSTLRYREIPTRHTYRSGLLDHLFMGPQWRLLEGTAKTNAVSEKYHQYSIDAPCWRHQYS